MCPAKSWVMPLQDEAGCHSEQDDYSHSGYGNQGACRLLERVTFYGPAASHVWIPQFTEFLFPLAGP
jgi:hypothetical protein